MGWDGHHHHCESHDSGHVARDDTRGSRDRAIQALRRSLGVTVLFMGVELAGGIWSNSLTLLSDAVHMGSDSLSLLFSLAILIWSSTKSRREAEWIENVGALLSGLALFGVAVFLGIEGIHRIQEPETIRGSVAFMVALLGLSANAMSLFYLRAEKEKNINIRAAYLHVIFDLLGSISALIASAAVWLWGVTLVDSVLSLALAGLMVVSAVRFVLFGWKRIAADSGR